jgi:alkanesulfonate monooxygenase SsuD/methylene tetrahydromethanopterin reductase-like flavin-dependent oxidoreductase (luciferase family)
MIPEKGELMNPETERELEEARQRERAQMKGRYAELVDAKVKGWAQADPDRIVGEWRPGGIVETQPWTRGNHKPITAAELANYTVVFAEIADACVFTFCDEHRTAFAAGLQAAARDARREDWCPGCKKPAAVVAAEAVARRERIAAELDAKQQRIDNLKASRKSRITKTTQIALERGVINEQQCGQLLAIWQEIQAPNVV